MQKSEIPKYILSSLDPQFQICKQPDAMYYLAQIRLGDIQWAKFRWLKNG